MELIIGFVIAMILLMLAAENETLADMAERRWINYLADQSRKNKPAGARKRSKYIKAGIFISNRKRRDLG